MYKIVTFCPPDQSEELIDVMSKAGAGRIGNYSHCAYVTHGEGTWFSEEGSNPTLGKVGELTKTDEDRIEMFCSDNCLKQVVEVIKKNHPYEEPEIDVYKLES
jgi:hypothetical protein